MMLLIGSMKFTSWSILEQKVGRRSDWTAKQFKPWLKKERPGSLEQVEEVLKLQKGIRNVDDSVPGMADVLE
ncbi:MAG: hypothetical protein GY861_00280 [bacterium]|nr:hypothetical protein [bacterium]